MPNPQIDAAHRWNTLREHCTWFVYCVARSAGKTLPIRLRLRDRIPNRALEFVLTQAARPRKLRDWIMSRLGHSGGWDLGPDSLVVSPYILRKYLQLRES